MSDIDLIVQRVGERAAARLDDIRAMFKPGVKITLLVRTPAFPDGKRDFLLTDDDLDAVCDALQQRKHGPNLTGAV